MDPPRAGGDTHGMDLDHGSVRTTHALVDGMPFATALGITLDAAGADEVRGRMDWAADRCTIGGALHGGALMTLADSVGAVCAYLNLPEGASTSTDNDLARFAKTTLPTLNEHKQMAHSLPKMRSADAATKK